MVVKKFFGATTRDALKQVRNELGEDALILSNRPVGGGVEIMAVADADVSALASSMKPGAAAAVAAPVPTPGKGPAGAAPATAGSKPASSMSSAVARTYAMPVEPLDDPTPSRPATTETFSTQARSSAPEPAPRPVPSISIPMLALTATTPPPPPPPPSPQSVYARYEAPAETAPAASDSSERFTEDSLPDLGGQAGAANSDEALEKLDSLSGEVREMRTMLQSQLASLAWANMEEHHPRQAELFRQMLALGLSPALCRQLVAKLPDNLGDEAALKWAKLALVHNLKTIDEQDEIIARGGVYALVGPTGIGKTTTVAKLAARATLRHGTERIALITTDSYRIGAQDQLRLYGKILGVSVFSVQNEADLHVTLADLADKHLVLIDSTGMGQRDARVDAQTQMYAHTAANGGRPISRVLVLAANAEGATLEDVVNRYLPGGGLVGCVMSKIDEAPTLGGAIDTIIRHRLPLLYVTNGQRVPEDLHLAKSNYLIDRAFKMAREASPYSLKSDEYQLLTSAFVGTLN